MDRAASSWIAPSTPDLVWFRGADTMRFLNDILTQELGDMELAEVRRSMLLTPDGKLDHLLWVVKASDGLGLITDPGRGEALIASLSRYKIRVDVEITPETRPAWLVIGRWDGIDISWAEVPRTLVLGERPELPSGTLERYEELRIQQGEPAFGVDVGGSTIPQETGLTGLAVDFEKGCFLGQELVGRIDARGGRVPRPLRALHLRGEASVGDEIVFEGDPVGRITSRSGSLALGVVKRGVEPGREVMVADTMATVVELPQKAQT